MHVFIRVVYFCAYIPSYGRSSFQMALSQKFRDAVLGTAVRISNLDLDTCYPVLHAEPAETKYGLSILLTIRESEDTVVKVFLPLRYSVVFTEEDLADINGQTLQYYLTYKG